MAAPPIGTVGGPRPPARSRAGPDPREIRIRFQSRDSLLSGFALAQGEPWMEDCRVDLPRLELVVHMAGGFGCAPPAGRPGRRRFPAAGPLRALRGGATD